MWRETEDLFETGLAVGEDLSPAVGIQAQSCDGGIGTGRGGLGAHLAGLGIRKKSGRRSQPIGKLYQTGEQMAEGGGVWQGCVTGQEGGGKACPGLIAYVPQYRRSRQEATSVK